MFHALAIVNSLCSASGDHKDAFSAIPAVAKMARNEDVSEAEWAEFVPKLADRVNIEDAVNNPDRESDLSLLVDYHQHRAAVVLTAKRKTEPPTHAEGTLPEDRERHGGHE